jgi:hypothetical protein
VCRGKGSRGEGKPEQGESSKGTVELRPQGVGVGSGPGPMRSPSLASVQHESLPSNGWSIRSRSTGTGTQDTDGSDGNVDAMEAMGQTEARDEGQAPEETAARVHPLLNLSQVDEVPALAPAVTAQPGGLGSCDGPFGSQSDLGTSQETLTGDIAAIIQSLQVHSADEDEVWGDADQLNLDGTVHRRASMAPQVRLS